MTSLLESKFDFFSKRAIFISTNKLSVFHWRRGEITDPYLFEANDAGREDFKRYLGEAENIPTSILVDRIEEEFRQDTIPHVFGSDREALIERKRARLFRKLRYFYAQYQGREEKGRRDDRFLFMALSNDEIIGFVTELLARHKIPLKGIQSFPLLLQSYIKTLPDITDYALVVTIQNISGLRQTFFTNKQLKISRLSKLPSFGMVSYASMINSEIDIMQRYLYGLRLTHNDTGLDIYILADSKTLQRLKLQDVSSPLLRKRYLDVNKLAGTSEQSVPKTAPFCDPLILDHLFRTKIKNNYASAYEMRYAKTQNIRHAMMATSALLILLSLAYSSVNFIDGLRRQEEIKIAKEKIVFYQNRYDFVREELPKTSVNPEQMRVATQAASKLAEYKSTPSAMLYFISRGLQQFPMIKLDDLDWAFSLNIDKNARKPLKRTNQETTTPTTDSDKNDKKEIKYYQISNLKAHIEPFNGDYRAAIKVVNQFAETLQDYNEAHDIQIKSLPLDVSSGSTLQGDTAAIGKEAKFTMRIVFGVTG